DASGFFYTQMAAPQAGADPMLGMQAKFHRLGSPVAQDPVVLADTRSASMRFDPEEFPGIGVTPGSDWAFAFAGGAHSEIRVAVANLGGVDLSGKAATPWKMVCEYSDGVENVVAQGDRIYLLSHKNASGRRVISLPAANPDLAAAQVEIHEDPAAPLVQISGASDALYAERMKNGRAELLRLQWGEKEPATLSLPSEGWVNQLVTDPLAAG